MQSFSPASVGVPAKLSWVTTPLLILFILQILALLFLPFLAPLLNGIMGAAATDPQGGVTAQDLGMMKLFTGATLWISWILTALWAAFLFFSWKAAQQGKSWARIAAIVVGILSLLNFPIGTIIGIFLLIGAFDKDVQSYMTR